MAHMPRIEADPLSTLALHPVQNTPDKGHTGSCLNYTNKLVPFLSGKDCTHMPVTVLLEVAKKKLIDTGNR
jgi:hypothetical protein